MWVALAFLSAALLGLYDVAKKRALIGNAVMPVLLLNTLFSSLFFLPFIISSVGGFGWFDGTFFDIPQGDFESHAMVLIKSAMVLTSWIFGYYGMKHLPITIVGPINATRPVLTLLGAMLIFGEQLNGWQWGGVLLALFSLFLLSRAGKSEGVDFRNNIWILSVAAAAIVGACCGLYDKHIMRTLDPMFVQGWYTLYQFAMMAVVVAVVWFPKRAEKFFRWSWAIPLISLFLTCADIAYLTALSKEGALIAVVSMIRRSSVIVSFCCGAVLFREKNLRTKALDLLFILLGMILLYIGSR
ncbi:MAG: DMT family transporter [Rikenellaceae bacterium]|nr:DMT family transporter [Rikenellaceae bacterium]